ncbi:putative fungal pheromone GPCR, STE3-type [Suillus lakei]|nr:putative fungal pheromone GPCR, STE3-type [Suillus lakei]
MQVGLPIGAFIAAVLVLIPLPWHWRAKNIATLSIITWLFVSNIIFAINSVIWAGSIMNVAPVWCDIATKIQIGANMALPACCLCICIQLERIASMRQVRSTYEDKMRRMLVDTAICWLLPMIYMALHYVVQGHRFDIVEDFGCRPTIYVSIAAICIIWVPPIAVALLTVGYAGVALMSFFRRRITFGQHLRDSNTGLTTSQYFRLMSMAVVEMFWGLLVTSLNMWFTCQHGLRPWISWENVHDGFSQIAYFPSVIIPPTTLVWTYALWWVVPISGALFFVFFSFGEDAMKDYRKSLQWFRTMVLRSPPPAKDRPTVLGSPPFARLHGPKSIPTLPPISSGTKSSKSASCISFPEKTPSSEDGLSIAKHSSVSESFPAALPTRAPTLYHSLVDSSPSSNISSLGDIGGHHIV